MLSFQPVYEKKTSKKYANLVDLESCWKTGIYMYLLAKIRLRYSRERALQNLAKFNVGNCYISKFANPEMRTVKAMVYAHDDLFDGVQPGDRVTLRFFPPPQTAP